MEELPAEVLARIFGLLDWQQLSQVEAVSRRCRSIGKRTPPYFRPVGAVLVHLFSSPWQFTTSALPNQPRGITAPHAPLTA
jgi:hypothetical protein